jgi:hypothetical protein
MSILAGSLRWVVRNLLSLLAIVLVLYFSNFLLREWRESAVQVSTARGSIPGLEASLVEIQQLAGPSAENLDRRMNGLRNAPGATLRTRRASIESELAARKAARRPPYRKVGSLIAGNRTEIVADYQREMEISLLELERESLGLLDHQRTLEDLHRRHELAYAALLANSAPDPKPDCRDSWASKFSAMVSSRARAQLRLCRNNMEAYREYRAQEALYVQLTRPRTAINVAQASARPVEAALEQAKATAARTSVGTVLHEIASYLPAALVILAATLLTPVAIKAFMYYVIAPLASRRPPIRLLPTSAAGFPDAPGHSRFDSDAMPLSSVSRTIQINADHELLVHSDYLQSSGTGGGKNTKWLLDARYPFASLAAGMTVLTRVRPASAESIVLSSTTDPFSEVGVLALAEGDAMVLQPRNLVGVLQPRNRPVRITSHWRLRSPSAWLTLQLRYLVFHGPARLVVKGCRGIRVERADTSRLINQAATMGFSANLAYSTTRSETFVAYLLGKQELFNDRFSDGPGFYVYEEMPRFGKRSGIMGRGLEGLLDSALKVFGI